MCRVITLTVSLEEKCICYLFIYLTSLFFLLTHKHTHKHTHTCLLFIVYSKQERLPAAHFRKNKQLKQSNTQAAQHPQTPRAATK